MPFDLFVFFTHNLGFDDWEKSGFTSREIKYYSALRQYSNCSVSFVEYSDCNLVSSYSYKSFPVFSFYRFKSFLSLRPIFRALKILFLIQRSADTNIILKTNQLKSCVPCLIAKLLFGYPLIVRVGYEPLLNELHNRQISIKVILLYVLGFLAYHFSDAIICTSPSIKSFINRRHFVNLSKISIIQNYIDLSIFTPPETPFSELSSSSKINVLFVGRLEPEKRPELFIAAMLKTDYNATVVGNGSMKNTLTSLAALHQHRFLFIDHLDNDKMPYLYQTSHFFVCSSNYEGNPKAILEAMASGCIILSPKIDGVKDIIIDGENGIFLKNDCSDLPSKILHILSNPHLQSRLRLNARKFVLSNNSLLSAIKEETFIINSLIK